MKKIMVVFVLGIMFATSSKAQFQTIFTGNILSRIGQSGMEKVDREQLRFIIQDAVDTTLSKLSTGTQELMLVDFLHKAQVIDAKKLGYYKQVFAYQSEIEPTKALSDLKQALTDPNNAKKIGMELNRQIGTAVIEVFQIGTDRDSLSGVLILGHDSAYENKTKKTIFKIMNDPSMSSIIRDVANEYFYFPKSYGIDELLGFEVHAPINFPGPRNYLKSEEYTQEIMAAFKKLF